MRYLGSLLFFILTIHSLYSAQNQDLLLRLPFNSSLGAIQNNWISEILTQDLTGYEIFQAKITPPSSESSLALTIFFEEKELKTIRVLWISSSGASHLLCSNLSEGTLLKNQRTILLPAALISSEGGTVLIQSDQITLDIRAIHFQWTSPSLLVSSTPTTNPHLLTPHGLLRSEEISGQPLAEKVDSAQSTIATTVLVSHPESIDNVAYQFELPQIPARSRIEMELQGLPTDETVRVYLNGIDLGVLPIETPSFNGLGYITEGTQFWGWRKSTLWIPETVLQSGINTIQLSTSSHRMISIKNLLLETDFKAKTQSDIQP